MTTAFARRLVLAGDVVGKGPLSAFAVASSAARADFTRSVSDDPCCVPDEPPAGVALFWFKPEPCAFAWSRHVESLMSSMCGAW